MKIVAGLLGVLVAMTFIIVTYFFFITSFQQKTTMKGVTEIAPILLGGIIIGAFALMLLWQSVCLIVLGPRRLEGL